MHSMKYKYYEVKTYYKQMVCDECDSDVEICKNKEGTTDFVSLAEATVRCKCQSCGKEYVVHIDDTSIMQYNKLGEIK